LFTIKNFIINTLFQTHIICRISSIWRSSLCTRCSI